MSSRFVLKLVAWGLALTLVLLPVIGVLNGWFASERWPVRTMQVDAEFVHVSAEQIRAAASAHLGTGFFAVKLDDVRAAVADLPWVEKVEVRKRWPDTLELHVQEQHPFARWGARRLIGRNGVLFTAPGGETIQGLPQLSGPDDALDRVVNFFGDSQRLLTGSGLTLSGVDLSARGSWTLVLASGAQIEIGRDHSRQRLQRFVAVLPRLNESNGAFEHADLRYTNGFAIRWPSAQPATPVPAPPMSARVPATSTSTPAAEANT